MMPLKHEDVVAEYKIRFAEQSHQLLLRDVLIASLNTELERLQATTAEQTRELEVLRLKSTGIVVKT